MNRRDFIALLGSVAASWPIAARAQEASKLPTIGFLGASTASAWSRWSAAFVQRLREVGWIDGRTVAIEYRWAEGRSERYAEIAAEFVRLKVDVILTVGGAVVAAQQATSVIPIVFAIAIEGRSQRSRWSEGRGPRGIRTSKARTGLRTSVACHRRWSVYGNLCRHTPEAGEAMGRAAEVVAPSSSIRTDGGCPVVQVNDLSRSLAAFDPISTLVVVVEMSKASWLVSSVVPGVERQPLKKLEPDATALLRLIERWRNEAVRVGRPISRIALAYEAGRDGFWLARWLIARGIEAHVIHSASVAVSRERKRAKTDRLDAAMLMRVFLGWLRGERGHCGMVVIPTMEEEAARRPSRERESLVNERSRITNRMKSALARLGIRGFKPHLRKAPERLADLRTAEGTGLPANVIEEFRRDMARLALVREQISSIEKTRAERLERAPDTGPHAMVRLLARVIGIGIETADMLVREILSRRLRDRRAVARYAGLTGSPDESGLKRREKGLAKAGNARVRRGLIQLAWRFLMFQKDSALARWYRTRTEGPSGARKTTMIVALARKLLIALWRLVTTGEVPDGVELRPAA